MGLIKLHTNPNIYNIKIPLPRNPLRDLNVYVIEDSGEAMVIDTGFRLEECRSGLQEGLRQLGIPMNRMKLFITHMHSDHSGQMDLFSREGCPVYMNERDIPLLKRSISGEGRIFVYERYLENGYPQELLEASKKRNPMYAHAPLNEVEIIPVHDGTLIPVGNLTVQCIHTGGHTPGHTCLYLESAGILFSGDHILYDITPNITPWEGEADALGAYLESLRRVKDLPFLMAFPAHREMHDQPKQRINELIEHHRKRLEEVLGILCRYPGITAYEVAGKMKWSIRCNGWEDFPEQQRWFAVGEALAHLDWLEKRRYITYRKKGELIRIYPYMIRRVDVNESLPC